MDAFASFHAPGFWLVMALLGAVVALGVRPFLPQPTRALLIPAYWVLLPYLALISGGVSPRLMGLVYIDWAVSLRIGVGLALTLVALALGMRAVSATRSVTGTANASATLRPAQHFWRSTLLVIGVCGAEEFFWAFLRGANTELLLEQQFFVDVPVYWAIWIAAVLAIPMSLVSASGAYNRLIKVTTLVVSSIVFFYTRNFWLGWLLHTAVWLLFLQPAQSRSSVTGLAPATPAAAIEKSQSQ